MVGWALFNGAWLGLLAAAGLAVFFDAKAGLEERWLEREVPRVPVLSPPGAEADPVHLLTSPGSAALDPVGPPGTKAARACP